MTHPYEPTPVELADIENRFVYHAPVGNQAARYGAIRSEAKALAELLLHNCPASRERSLALTALEEFIFWANASIARHEDPKHVPGA